MNNNKKYFYTRNRAFRKYQYRYCACNHFPVIFSLVQQDCATRWGSKYAMTDRILALLPHIRRVFADDRSRRTLPTISWQDVSVLEAIKEGLKSVSEFTDIMSSEREVTISSLLPLLRLFLAQSCLLLLQRRSSEHTPKWQITSKKRQLMEKQMPLNGGGATKAASP